MLGVGDLEAHIVRADASLWSYELLDYHLTPKGYSRDITMKMAEEADPIRLLFDILEAGRLTPQEFRVLHSAVQNAQREAVETKLSGGTLQTGWHPGQAVSRLLHMLCPELPGLPTFRYPSWPLRRLPTEMSAAQVVMNTPELREHILLFMPHTDLLRAQRICRDFRETISTTPALRRKLFREADKKCTYITRMPFTFFGRSLRPEYLTAPPTDRMHYEVSFALDRKTHLRMRDYPSLQETLIAQPPLHTATLRVTSSKARWGRQNQRIVVGSSKPGVTIGDVLSAVDRAWRNLARENNEFDDEATFEVYISPGRSEESRM
ncbi:hypothetical protein LTR37_013834 [Vermiconidia calcicola]|uniref:Uncharacterized protein n=1 Tax=Vermiconidia calcicola TaxID=1690605 RepID=A0ACC3MVU0_9PEZI|nr:hypothetical protein LTR37_013834 [Vermiconidia calcicola]